LKDRQTQTNTGSGMSKQRELKFRVWDGERMIVPDNGEHVIFWNDPKHIAWGLYAKEGIKITDSQYGIASVMQFTGLHDKNGREIYDRDIVDGYDGLRFDVQWLEYDAEWNIGGYDAKRMDVIGNCFENPELIPTN